MGLRKQRTCQVVFVFCSQATVPGCVRGIKLPPILRDGLHDQLTPVAGLRGARVVK